MYSQAQLTQKARPEDYRRRPQNQEMHPLNYNSRGVQVPSNPAKGFANF